MATNAGQSLKLVLVTVLVIAPLPLRGETSQASFDQRWPQVRPIMVASENKEKSQRSAAALQAGKSQLGLPQTLYLIRSTLLTLNDANRSGNYTVLRDLAAPGFQSKNTPADLAQIFSNLRRLNVDLYAVALLAPELSSPPHVERGMLRLTGRFPTQPLQIAFDLLFQDVGNQWKLFGISVATPKTVAPQANLPGARKKQDR